MHWSTHRALTAVARKGHDALDADLLDVLALDRMRPRAQQWKCCSHPGCPELVNARNPCPQHGRPLNAPWSKDRDRQAQHVFRDRVLEAAGHRCERCGAEGVPLQAHHDSPTEGRALCEPCHAAVDANARVT